MEANWSNEIIEILKVGQTLDQIGINNWALTKNQSLLALDHFLEHQIPILGGDVYKSINGVIQPNLDSWYCDRLQKETKDDFLKRSIIQAKNYIEKYEVNQDNKFYFVFVPSI